MMDNSGNTMMSESFYAAHYIERPRIDRILDQATGSKLVYVIAGAGYGKTQAVRHYVSSRRTP